MDYSIDIKPVFRELQSEVAKILNENLYLKNRNISVLCEDLLDIDFQIRNALGKQGVVVVVNTLQASYIGHDGLVNAYQIDNLEIDVVESPSVWRPYLKKNGFEDGTTTDILHIIAEILGGPQSGRFGRYNPKSIEVGEDSSLVVGKLKLQTTVRQNVEGVIEEPTKVEIPFITKHELAELLDEVEYLKNLVEDFSTEEIKQDISDLKTSDSQINGRIDSLSEVYQPKGNYVAKSDLTGYALKSQVPTNVSQLNNDSGYIKDVYWENIKRKPDLALKGEVPVKTSQLENDAGFVTDVYWYDISDRPDVAVKTDIPTKTSQLVNDSGFLTSIPSLDNYATKADLREAVRDEADIRLGEDAKLKAEIDNKADRTELNQYAMLAYVDTEIGAERSYRIESDLELETKINKKADKSEIPTKTSQLENDSGFITETPDIPTKTSQLENDSGFISLGNTEVGDGYISLTNERQKHGVRVDPDIITLYRTDDEEATSITHGTIWVTQNGRGTISVGDVNKTGWRADLEVGRFVVSSTASGTTVTIDGHPLPTAADIPTKTSQLENDSGFLTTDSIEIPRKTSQLENDSGYITNVYWDDISDRPTLPTKMSQLVNDAGYLKEVAWWQIDQKPTIPTKTSQLVNDSGYKTAVYWADVQNKPEIATKLEIAALEGRVDGKLSQKLDKADYNDTEIYSSSHTKKIDGNGDVYVKTSQPGHWTPWTWSDGEIHDDPTVYQIGLDRWRIGSDMLYISVDEYDSEEEATHVLETAEEITFLYAEITVKSTREWIEGGEEVWSKTDELAYKSDLEDSGISEDECREIVEGYGYQTSEQVESAITDKGYQTQTDVRNIINGYGFTTSTDVNEAIVAKGYRTESQVESQIAAKGYQTESQVRSIAASTLPTGYVETELIGTLEDGTQMSFTILTKANA